MQELYLAMDLRKEKYREHMIRVFVLMFRHYNLSEADFSTLFARGAELSVFRLHDGYRANFRAPHCAHERVAILSVTTSCDASALWPTVGHRQLLERTRTPPNCRRENRLSQGRSPEIGV